MTKETNEVGATTEEPVVLVSINRIHKDALVDSGSVSKLISLNEFNELKAQGLKASLTNYNNNNNNNYIYSAHIPFGICSYAHDNLIRRI